jgi:hypothetical protein
MWFSKTKRFVPWIIKTAKKRRIHRMRIHTSGDFYDVAYIRRWIRIVKALSDVTFYTYTRAWMEPCLLEELKKLGRLHNMVLWLSTDRTMPQPPRDLGFPVGYLSTNDSDVPKYPVDIVFRDKPTTPRRMLGGNLVCPFEQLDGRKITCTHCKLCFQDATDGRKNYRLGHKRRSNRRLRTKTVKKSLHLC